jgi:radical SAM protein with 4Fe4S-binding SPASM domain
MMARSPDYDLLDGTFKDGWGQFLPRVREQKWTNNVACRSCELIAMCGQCPGWSQMEFGDQQRPVGYLCEIAHRRAEAFAIV